MSFNGCAVANDITVMTPNVRELVNWIPYNDMNSERKLHLSKNAIIAYLVEQHESVYWSFSRGMQNHIFYDRPLDSQAKNGCQ